MKRWLSAGVMLPVILAGLLISSPASEDDAGAAAPDFQRDVLPIFEEKCIRCHGGKRRGGKLDMRTVEALLAGGDTGPAIKRGNVKKSLLIELIHFKEMPPKKEKTPVTALELDVLHRWIESMQPES